MIYPVQYAFYSLFMSTLFVENFKQSGVGFAFGHQIGNRHTAAEINGKLAEGKDIAAGHVALLQFDGHHPHKSRFKRAQTTGHSGHNMEQWWKLWTGLSLCPNFYGYIFERWQPINFSHQSQSQMYLRCPKFEVFCPGIYQLSETLRVKHCGQASCNAMATILHILWARIGS